MTRSARSVGDANAIRDSTSKVSRAVMSLREMLLRGKFRPGQRIAEIPLSSKLGISRTPLRVAFEKLANEGLLKVLPNSGFAASEFSIEDVWEAIETRSTLEGAAARFAAERCENPAQLEPLRRINRTVEDILRSDIEAFTDQYLDLNRAFHSAILDLANNQVLRRATEQVWMLPFASPNAVILLYKNVPASKEIIPIAREHHRAVINAIEHREGSRAENLWREHARLSRCNLEVVMRHKTILESFPGGSLLRFRNAGNP